jgi:hypothetical protein
MNASGWPAGGEVRRKATDRKVARSSWANAAIESQVIESKSKWDTPVKRIPSLALRVSLLLWFIGQKPCVVADERFGLAFYYGSAAESRVWRADDWFSSPQGICIKKNGWWCASGVVVVMSQAAGDEKCVRWCDRKFVIERFLVRTICPNVAGMAGESSE